MIRTHVSISLDGFTTFADGLPAWDAMPTFGPGSHGTDQLADCDAVLMGRTTFDQGFEHWVNDWPYKGKPVYVLTSRPPLRDDAADFDVSAAEGGPAEVAQRLRDRDGHLLGGANTIQAFLEAGAIDRLGIVVLPVRLERGIPLFDTEPTAFSSEAWAAADLESPTVPHRLRLESHRTFPDGAVELVYAP
jgi:dihydrofolate reductase